MLVLVTRVLPANMRQHAGQRSRQVKDPAAASLPDVPKDAITEHLRGFPPPQRAALEAVRATIRSVLPQAVEGLAWGMPTFRIDGEAVVCYEGFRRHNSLFPMSGTVVAELGDALAGFDVTKGTIHFPLETPFPARLLRRVIALRVDDINDSFPKKSGEMKHFYANGVLQSRGRMKGGELHGAWEWFRKDGTLMRSGSFKGGIQIGEWTTYDRSGRVVKVTDFGR